MTATLTDRAPVASQPYDTPEFTTLPQTPGAAPGQSVWTQLHAEFVRLSQTRAAATEYARWRRRHDWRADTPAQLAADLRDDPAALAAVVSLYQDGSRLAAAMLAEAFRPALITFTRYTRIDQCEQVDRPAVRAQVVLATFYEVASTTDARSTSIAGRLYGETLKRVTRERAHVPQYPAPWDDLTGSVRGRGQNPANLGDVGRRERSKGRDESRYVPDWGFFKETHIDVAPIATRPTIDWERIERKGLARDVLAAARADDMITAVEHDILAARFLGDALVPVPTLARQNGVSVSYCETKIRRALLKLAEFYSSSDRATEPTVA
jgi:hypothetical protein